MLFRALAPLALVIVLAIAAQSARAVTTVSYMDFAVRIWQAEDGLPQNTVTAITQTRDGYLWVGTLAGLARFDGERFFTFDSSTNPRLPESRISTLFENRDGVLWIGHESGSITRFRNGVFEIVQQSTGNHGHVAALGADENGIVWALRSDGSFEPAENPPPQTEPTAGPALKRVRFARHPSGQIWFSVDGDARELRDDRVHRIDLGPVRVTDYVRALGAAADGGWWVVRDNHVRKWSAGRWTEDRGSWGDSEINGLIELHDGSLAFATLDDGVHVVRPDGSRLVFNNQSAQIQNWVRVVYEDREGTMWFGDGSGGLVAVRRSEFGVLNPPDNWQGRTVMPIAAGPDGSLWMGTEGAGLYRYLNGAWRHYGETEGLTNPYVWSITKNRRGEVWVGTWGGGVFRLVGDSFERVSKFDLTRNATLSMYFEDDIFLAGTNDGVFRARGGVTEWLLRDLPVGPVFVPDITRDSHGALWFALGGAGLAKVTAEGVTQFGPEQGLSPSGVQCLLPDGDALWIGTLEAGLARYKNGRFATIGPAQGFPSKVICHIADDGLGYLWISTHHGLVRANKAELNRCADGTSSSVLVQIYGREDGLPTLEFSGGLQAAGCRTADGHLWFSSGKGVVSVNPAAIRVNPLAPPVVIESMEVDRMPFAATKGAASREIQPGHQRVEFQYTALSLAASGKTLFKYQLVGLDQDWIDAGTKRNASYSHLPPGDYRFHVIACNNDRVWNTQGAWLAFTVRPYFWQTWWFRIAVVVAVLSAFGWATRAHARRRLQRRVAELEYERGLERERARIAQDIHDDIGSSLTRISMLSQSVRQDADAAYQAPAVLERVHDTAVEVTHALDEIVWAVDPQHDTLDSLVCYVARFAQDRLGEANIICRLDLPVNLPAWPLNSQVRHNLVLAFKEALNNILKHARASEVKISLNLGDRHFAVAIEDNGCGFNSEPAGDAGCDIPSGNGLANLRRRLTAVGGECEISALPGRGTRILFTVHLPNPPPQSSA
ncbi:MAG TPA: two-component regulator propeller domain-containing protein [Opitutaceae bacterium]|nr:two-component regulator propeller domain-containing protein [Opitutaceae bacterium]